MTRLPQDEFHVDVPDVTDVLFDVLQMECELFAYVLVLICMGLSLLVAGGQDISDGNPRDGRFMIALGMLFLLAGAFAGIPL